MFFRIETRAKLEISEQDRETLLKCLDHFTGAGKDIIRQAVGEYGCNISDMAHLNMVTLKQLERLVESGKALPEIVCLHSMMERALTAQVAIDERSMRIISLIKQEENGTDESNENRTDNGEGDLSGEGSQQALRSDQDRQPPEDH